jgi:hypothetical protein
MKLMSISRNTLTLLAFASSLAVVTSCSADGRTSTAPRATQVQYALSNVTTTSFTLSSVTPPIQCVDASGAVTTVTGGNVVLSSSGKVTATFATSTTSGTTQSYSEKGTFTQTGSVIVFKVSGSNYTGTIDNGTLTIADYPLCGTTHTAIFNQV